MHVFPETGNGARAGFRVAHAVAAHAAFRAVCRTKTPGPFAGMVRLRCRKSRFGVEEREKSAKKLLIFCGYGIKE